MLSAVTGFWPKLGSEESPTGSLPDAQCLGSSGNLIRCQKKKVRIISVLFCLGPARKAKYSKVLSWPHAEGHVQSARSQFFPRIIFNPFILFCIFTKLYNHHNQIYNIFNDLKRSPYSHCTPPIAPTLGNF